MTKRQNPQIDKRTGFKSRRRRRSREELMRDPLFRDQSGGNRRRVNAQGKSKEQLGKDRRFNTLADRKRKINDELDRITFREIEKEQKVEQMQSAIDHHNPNSKFSKPSMQELRGKISELKQIRSRRNELKMELRGLK